MTPSGEDHGGSPLSFLGPHPVPLSPLRTAAGACGQLTTPHTPTHSRACPTLSDLEPAPPELSGSWDSRPCDNRKPLCV